MTIETQLLDALESVRQKAGDGWIFTSKVDRRSPILVRRRWLETNGAPNGCEEVRVTTAGKAALAARDAKAKAKGRWAS